VTFRLDDFNAHNGGHLVIGRGDLLRFYNSGKPPLGSGVIVGEAAGCNAPGQISMLIEDWHETYSRNDDSTCFNGLDRKTVYTVVVLPNRYVLSTGGVVIADVRRASGHHEVPGFFVFGAVSDKPYSLLSVSAKAVVPSERLK
jgi:hypothetical protein